ncbi:MAG: ABC-ATPase domain-containing protein [Thermodesulfobacteriota bacterium]
MRSQTELKKILQRISGRGYKAYKDLEGDYDCGWYSLHVDHVQSDPFAPPSRIRVGLPQAQAGFSEDLYFPEIRRIALQDYLTRAVARAAARGKSQALKIDSCGQEILERSSMLMQKDRVEARLSVSLPAKGRTIQGREAQEILCSQLPQIIQQSLIYENLVQDELFRHIQVCEDQETLRGMLQEQGLVAFVGNGSILPRASGVSERPLDKNEAIAFEAPGGMEYSFELPHQGRVNGLGIPAGVTLIVGGGYHGKSTMLQSLQRGVYNHIPDDGRELVVTEKSAFKIRAEDGRSVAGVDIQPFISSLPFGRQTGFFSSPNASGSTSQAANIMEALEAESRLLLLDEDTSATNFMIRDSRMQKLVAKEHEPITPFIDRVQELYKSFGVSTIMVLGGSGDYLDVADQVLMLKEYQPLEVTGQAREVAAQYQNQRVQESASPMQGITDRRPLQSSFRLGPKDKIKAKSLQGLAFGRQSVDLSWLEQLVDPSQTRAIAEVFRILAQEGLAQGKSLGQILEELEERLDGQGLDALSRFKGKHPGDLARPRKQEICAALNRLRSLRVEQEG